MAGLGQRVLDEGAEGLFGLADAEFGLPHQLDAERREQGLQLRQLAGVVGCQYQLHVSAPPPDRMTRDA